MSLGCITNKIKNFLTVILWIKTVIQSNNKNKKPTKLHYPLFSIYYYSPMGKTPKTFKR